MAKHIVYSAAETAHLLRNHLGPFLAWSYVLADMRRDRTTVEGLTLLPVCRIHDGIGYVPFYRREDLARFIHEVSLRHPEAVKGKPVEKLEVDIDLEDGNYWFARKFKRTAPIRKRPARP